MQKQRAGQLLHLNPTGMQVGWRNKEQGIRIIQLKNRRLKGCWKSNILSKKSDFGKLTVFRKTSDTNILSYQGFHLFILRTLESREKKTNISEAPVVSQSSHMLLYTIPCAVNIADSEMLSSQGMVPTLNVTIRFFLPIATMQRRTEIILRKLLGTLLQTWSWHWNEV